jgi:DNA-directed RNA polymerase specialized sigma24 family protein
MNNQTPHSDIHKTDKPERFYQSLYERFMSLAKKLLCDVSDVEVTVQNVLTTIQELTDVLPPEQPKIQWAMMVFDNHIVPTLFQEARSGSQEAENRLFTIIRKRLFDSAEKRVWHVQDREDVIQDALATIYRKYKKLPLNTPLLKWSWGVLYKKIGNYIQKVTRQKAQETKLPKEQMEQLFIRYVDHYIQSRRKGKNHSKRKEPAFKEIPEAHEVDIYQWGPIINTECNNLKNKLYTLVQNMAKECKQIFRILFSGGNRKDIIEAFPDFSIPQIDVWIHRCRKRLKNAAKKGDILS